MNYDYNPFGRSDDFDYYGSMAVTDAKKSISRTTLGLFLFCAVPTAILLVLRYVLFFALGKDGYIALASNPYYYIPMGTLFVYAVGFPFLWLLIKALPVRRSYTSNSLTIPEFLATIPIMQFAASIGSSIGTGLDGVMQELFHTTSENPVNNLTDGVPIWLMLIITVVIGPVVEEFIFRKLILNRLSVYGNVFAIILSAALFGLFHGNLYQMFYAFFIGLILGYVTVKGGSWLWGVALHVFMNFANGALPTILEGHFAGYEKAMIAFLEGDGDTFVANFNSFMIAGSFAIVVSALSVAGAIILVYTATKRLIYVKNAPEASIPVGKLPAVIFVNTGMILFILYTVFCVINEYIPLI